MAAVVHDTLSQTIAAEKQPYWWQCCILIEAFEKADHLKTESHG